ncbi:MAG: VOC family protein [Gemmatimonadaceae bacterium]
MPRVVHFEMHALDPERAIAFYEAVFGRKFAAWGGPPGMYWLVTTGAELEPGIQGGLVKRPGRVPTDGQAVNGNACTVAVDNVDAMHEAIEARGGVPALPEQAIPGVGWLVYCKDSKGNIVELMQNDPTAR